MNYWVLKKNNFATGAMKAAYGTFLIILAVIYEYDRVADQAAKEFNVFWSRTTPVMLSMTNDIEKAYITGEMDHRMGMSVVENAVNVYSFRLTCSFAFSLVEELVGHNTYNVKDIGSATLSIFKNLLAYNLLIYMIING